ncbi:MAG: hypothetical protein ACK4SN_09645, partial [Bellilinea sp.]
MLKFIKNLFGREKNQSIHTRPLVENIQTAPLTEEQLQVVSIPTVSMSPPHFLVGCGQSVGRQREHNEDA